jgi:hypothetical protein
MGQERFADKEVARRVIQGIFEMDFYPLLCEMSAIYLFMYVQRISEVYKTWLDVFYGVPLLQQQVCR